MRTIHYRDGAVRGTLSGPLHEKVARLLRTETYAPVIDAMDAEMARLVVEAREKWPVGRGALQHKKERAAGTFDAAVAATGQTEAGKTHSRDRFSIVTTLTDDSITVAAHNGAPYARYISSWKIGLSPTQIQDEFKRARVEKAAEESQRKELLRGWYAAKGEAKRDGKPPIGSFDEWIARTPAAMRKPLSTYIERPRQSPLWVLLRHPQRAAADRLVTKIGPLLRRLVTDG